MGIRVFIVGYVKSHFFYKTSCFGKSLATGTSCKFQSPNNRMVRLYFLSCNNPAVLTLKLPTCFTRVLDFGGSPLVSQSWVLVVRSLWLHTFDQFFTLSHTQPLHYSYLNTRFLNAELQLQANLAWNKANSLFNLIIFLSLTQMHVKMCGWTFLKFSTVAKFFFGFAQFKSKGVNTVPEVVPIWLTVRYISDTGQYWYTVSGLPLCFIFINK